MSRVKVAVSRAELTRCLKAARDAGYECCRVECDKPDGTRVRVIAGEAADADAPADEFDELIGRLPDASP